MAVGQLSDLDILALVTGTHADPFAVLGVHRAGRHTIVRAFAPTAHDLTVTESDGQPLAAMQRLHAAGLFEARLPARKGAGPLRFEARGEAGSWAFIDAYGFGPVLGPMDDHFAAEGSHLRLFDRLGAHVMTHEGVGGVHFAVWAPNARRVSVVGDFNQWDGRRHIMRFRRGSGIWEIFVPDVGSGALYKYELIGADGRLALKSDPYAFAGELRPGNASVVAQIDTFAWSDGAYLEERARRDPRRSPVSIYEVHAGSWRRPGGGFPSWSDLAETLIPYVRDMGFSHIELLPVSEHPLDASWGYQPTGLFAPTARFGSPEGFAGFVDAAHAAGLGVILDWVPAHFPTDAHGLARFDGTALYEHADPRQGFHPDWNTAIYNFGRREVANFLINNALFWLEKYHVDGLRVDAVASMLYLDYSRKAGEWIANREGGRENLDAIDFLKALNRTVYAAHPSVLMIAEESTSFPSVTQPVHAGGLGFGFKWNMGFMHDTLRYLKREPVHRKHHHADLTFGLLYAFSENFVLPLSHDEVVHGKASLLHKMTGDDWQKFASLRAYYAFMWGYPGKKLLFMGQEFGQRREWSEERELDWTLLGHAPHGGLSRLVRDLNGLYGTLPALHARDCESEGFAWLVVDDAARSTVAFVRRGGEAAEPVVVVSNFTPVPRPDYLLPMPAAGRWRECLNSDAGDYGGSGIGNLGVVTAEGRPLDGQPARARLHLPPLATLILARG